MLVTGGRGGNFNVEGHAKLARRIVRGYVRYGVLCVLADWNYAANFGPLKELGWNAALEDALLDEYTPFVLASKCICIYIERERESCPRLRIAYRNLYKVGSQKIKIRYRRELQLRQIFIPTNERKSRFHHEIRVRRVLDFEKIANECND